MAATPQLLAIFLEAWLGNPDYRNQLALAYSSPSTLQGGFVNSQTVSLPAGGGIQSFNLANLFPAATNVQMVAVMDITSGGQTFSCNNFNPPVPIAAGAPLLWVQNGGLPPTIQLSNPAGAAAAQVEIIVVSL